MYATTRPDIAGWEDGARETFLDLQFRAQRQEWTARFPGSEGELILSGGSPIGRVWVAWSVGECVLVDLTLLPEHRRSGIGTQVIRTVLVEADRRGVPVRATVALMNHASLAFFGRLGFVPIAEDAVYVSFERPVNRDRQSREPG